MKSLITLLIALCSLNLSMQAQYTDAIKDSNNNYRVVDNSFLLIHDSTTANTITELDGSIWPVYVGPKGGVYYWATKYGDTKPDAPKYKRYIRTRTPNERATQQ